jgi:predicted ferric reductase
MGYSLRRAIAWLALLIALSLVPLGLARLGAVPPSRSFAVEFGVALGFIGLGLMALQTIVSGRIRWVAPSFGMDNVIQYHRQIGWIAAGFVLAHPVAVIWGDRSFLEYLDPRVNAPRTIALVAVTLAVIAIVTTSVWREAFGLQYESWRLIHGVLGMSIIFIGVVHVVQVGHYVAPVWKKALLVGIVGATLYPVLHTRIVRPALSRKRRYEVTAVEPERNDCWSLTLDPVGHEGMRFEPGQFVWITLGETPFSLQQHPFTIASSARRRPLTLTAGALGDFTATWKDIEPGTWAFLEGPFGSFTPDPSPETGLFMVMGGIGITPAMSMLRTMKDDRDPRRAVLLYGSQTWDKVVFREELGSLEQELNLTVVHILEDPPEGWRGERGLLDEELLRRYVPPNPHEFQYLTCGPKPLMDIAEIALREMGISWKRIYSERFDIV